MFFRITFLNQLFQLLVKHIGKVLLMLVLLLMLLQAQALVKLAIADDHDPTAHLPNPEQRDIDLDSQD